MRTATRKTPVYVLCDDGRLHRDAFIFGESAAHFWRLCFRQDGHTDLIVYPECDIDGAAAVIQGEGISASVLSAGHGKMRLINDRPRQCSVFRIDIRSPLPAALFDDAGVWQPAGECVVYNFGGIWG